MVDLVKSYNYYFYELADERTRDWVFVGPPLPIVIITCLYLYCVLYWGPNFMKHRPAYSLNNFNRVYDVFQILFNAYFVYIVCVVGWVYPRWNNCPAFDYTRNPISSKSATACWITLMVKLLDYVETIVFVLRKRQRQVSFLHLYHHISTVIIMWLAVTYYSGGMTLFYIGVNAIVHIIMYTYYFLTTFGPTVKRFASAWKPAITKIQMIQFWFLLAFSVSGYSPKCRQFLVMANVMIFDLLMNFFLFYNFYRQNYKKPKTT